MTDVARGRTAGLIARFASRRVLVLGDAMIDRFIWGDVGLSPEAPVPVLRVTEESFVPGGAGNVAANLAALGARVFLAGVCGVDRAGDRLQALLSKRRIESLVLAEPSRVTTVKTRLMAQGRQTMRVDRDGSGPLPPETARRLLDRVLDVLEDVEAVVLSDYAKGVLQPQLVRELLASARRIGIPVVVDPKPTDLERFSGCTLLTPNEREAGLASGLQIRGDSDCELAARRILRLLDARAVLVTRGERGMLLLEGDRQPVLLPAMAREVYDVTGAGDTVAAVMTICLAAGGELEDAAALANRAAGRAVAKVGTAVVEAAELLQEVLAPV